MDSITIYEFLQEKGITPTGPDSYSNSKEMSNVLKTFKKNNSSKTKKKKDVNFYDYNGTLVDSYSAEEFLQLSTMPANPSHDGLTAQGWNYTLPNAKEYISEYGKLDIGQMYITDDGKTRLYIHLNEGRLSPTLGIGLNGLCNIDWGDDSESSTINGSDLATLVTSTHTYVAPGDYVITLDVTGSFTIIGNESGTLLLTINGTPGVYGNSLKRVEVGERIVSIGDNAFNNCYSLTSITIPNGVTSISDFAFFGCFSLTNITIPNSVTSIGDNAFGGGGSLTNITIPNSVTSIGGGAFFSCLSLTNITIPNSVTNINGGMFGNCRSLTNITIPNSVTNIGSEAFTDCYSLKSIAIPNGVTNIGDSMFYSCCSLTNITIPNSVTSIGNYAFGGCCSLTNITIPNSVTSIGNSAFSTCNSLKNITIPNGVTNIDDSTFDSCNSLTNITIPNSVTSIGDYAFNNCPSLTNITIPNSVARIGSFAFFRCKGLGFIKFKRSSPPSATQAWSGILTDCIIYVPQGSLSAYTSASDYPSSSTYTYIEY